MTEATFQIYEVTADSLLQALRRVGRCEGSVGPTDSTNTGILRLAGLVEDDSLTTRGKALFKTAWVQRDRGASLTALGTSLRALLPIQVLEQELRGFGSIDEEAALDLLLLHRAAPPSLSVEQARRTFLWLNDCKLVVYSKRFKTIRSAIPSVEAPQAGEDRSLAAMVSPKTPYTNLVRLRRILRTLRGVVYWADPHFGVRALEDLAVELDPASAKKLCILSRGGPTVLTPRSFKDYQKFQQEMALKGVTVEWRIDSVQDWHDRWLVDDEGAFNMPPVNSLYMGQYAEMLPASSKPPVIAWWQRAQVRQA